MHSRWTNAEENKCMNNIIFHVWTQQKPHSEFYQLHSHGNQRLHNKEKNHKIYVETDKFFSTNTPHIAPMAVVN